MAIMARRRRYTLVYANVTVKDHLRAIDTKDHALIRAKIDEQLQVEPAVETGNRKPLQQPAAFEARWEIRFGPDNRFRVLYDIDKEERRVLILAIGEKDRERLLVGGKEIKL
jgi:mRNA-degrading endonuclease RelE of RelBE toxin-antitoxin system